MSKESKIIRSLTPQSGTSGNEMILPNHSGDHVRSIKRQVPVADADLSNKKYVDDEITTSEAAAALIYLKLDASNDPITESLTLNKGLVINETGADSDFRVESVNNPSMFIVDAATDRVGIGASPTASDEELQITQAADTAAHGFILKNVAGTDNFRFYINSVGEAVFNGDTGLRFNTSGITRFNGGSGHMYFNLAANYFFYFRGGANNVILGIDSDAPTNSMLLNAGALIINNSNADYDFRIEGTTDTVLFQANAGTNSIGISTGGTSADLLTIGGDVKLLDGTASYFKFPDDATGYIEAWNQNRIQFSSAETQFSGSATNYVSISTAGIVKFVGTTAGLHYGSCWGNEIAWSQATAAQNTWYDISDANITTGQLNGNVTHSSGQFTVGRAGRYDCNYDLSVQSSIANKHIQCTFSINGTETNDGMNHGDAIRAGSSYPIGGCAILDLAANDTVNISVRTTDAGTPTLGVDHYNVTVKQIGGT